MRTSLKNIGSVAFSAFAGLALIALLGCSALRIGSSETNPSFRVGQMNEGGRYATNSAADWRPLGWGTRLPAGSVVQTPADSGAYVDMWFENTIFVRVNPNSLIRIVKLQEKEPGNSAGAASYAGLRLEAGSVLVGISGRPGTAGCDVSFTNGVARIQEGGSGIADSGRVEVIKGAATLRLAGKNEQIHIQQGYVYDPALGRVQPRGGR